VQDQIHTPHCLFRTTVLRWPTGRDFGYQNKSSISEKRFEWFFLCYTLNSGSSKVETFQKIEFKNYEAAISLCTCFRYLKRENTEFTDTT